MTSVAQLRPARSANSRRIGDAGLKALMRWHYNRGHGAIIALRQQHPSWPLIECNAQPQAFAPSRGGPSHAA